MMMNRRLQRSTMESESKNPPEKEGHHSLLKKLLSYPLYAILSIILVHVYFDPFSFSSPPTINIQIPPSNTTTPQEFVSKNNATKTPCNYSHGEWVPHKEEPLYNGTTCDTIKKAQNCMANGRPDKQYLYWKWRPKDCNLPKFDPKIFLKLLQNKHIAFVGDSLARNQLESLLCMTAAAAKPVLLHTDGEENKFRKWTIPSYNLNVSSYWSPFLVKGIEHSGERVFNSMFLDSPDEKWAADLAAFDVVVLAAGHWFLNRAIYYYNGTLLGCHERENCTEIGFYDAYGRALTTSFKTIVERKEGREKEINVFLTTFMPAHFVGEWDNLDACNKTAPFGEKEQIFEGMNYEMRKVGVEKVEEARIRAGDGEVRFEVLDVSMMALMRPDGHPGPYMIPNPFANGVGERVMNDCVHWCLPGPIDAWNEVLLELIKIQTRYDS